MKIIDKASWQIDAGISKNIVLQHFKNIFSWLNSKNMLTQEGIEDLEFGIDESVSLNERNINFQALAFFESEYDEYLRFIDYGNDNNALELEKLYIEYESIQK
ncbi:MAG: hypothetical protein FWC91_08610 [Defluviitaleaceae bacterium]|nr:hypothetical protein [Defluviitaleaceae bacterium]